MQFVFGDIVVDTEQVKLTKGAMQIECEPRVFDLMVYFCLHPEEAISREELITHVWDGRIVSDAAVNRAVGELRKIIKEDPSSPQWIKTVSKVGYKLTVTPEVLTNKATISNNLETPTNTVNTSVITNKAIWISLILLFIIVGIYLQITKSGLDKTRLIITERQPLTTSVGSAFNPFYHEKSNTLLYLYRSSLNTNAQIYLKQEPSIPITNDDYYYTDVVYADTGYVFASRVNNLQQKQCEIVKIELDSQKVDSILGCGEGNISQIVYDNSNNRLVYQYRASISEPYALYSYQLDTGRKIQITHPQQRGNNTGDYVFALSPDNQKLAIVEYLGDGIDELKIVDINNNKASISLPFINNVFGLVWRTNDQIFASNNDGLYEFSVEELSVNKIEMNDQYGRLAIGAGKSILTEWSRTTINIFRYSNNETFKHPMTASRGANINPTLGNSSNIMAFLSDRTGKKQIYIQEENKPEVIATFDGELEYVDVMAWSPDDDILVASINNRLFAYSLNNKSWQALAQQYKKVHYVSFVGQTIMFSAEVDGQWNIWQLDLGKDEIVQVTKKGGYSVQGEGRLIYFTKFNHDGLYKLDLTSGEESKVVDAFPIVGWRHWQLRGNSIYYLLGKQYFVIDINSGNRQALKNFDDEKPNRCHFSFRQELLACEHVEFRTSNIWQLKWL
jgi:DNA-binding winged helix-turn-helix (wHTH) protein